MMFSNTKSGKGVTLFTKFVAAVMSVVVFTLISGSVIDRQAKHVTLVTVNDFDGTENLRTVLNAIAEANCASVEDEIALETQTDLETEEQFEEEAAVF